MKIKSLVRILGTIALLILIFRKVDLWQVAGAFSQMKFSYWLAAFALLVFTQLISVLRWKVIANVVGFGGSYGRYASFFFIGMFFNLALPTSVGGDVVRAWYLAYQMGDGDIPNRRSKAALTVFADRFSGVLVLIVIAVVASLLSPVNLPSWIRGSIAFVAIGASAFLAMWPVAKKVARKFAKLKVLLNGVRLWVKNRKAFGSTTLMSIWVQVASVCMCMLVGQGLGLPISWTYYFVLVPMVTLITMLPISLGGMGLREGATVLMLAPMGIEAAQAVALSVLFFSVYAATSLIGLVYYLGAKARPPEDAARDVESAAVNAALPSEELNYGNDIGNHSDQRRAG